jgi:hypothetical protein
LARLLLRERVATSRQKQLAHTIERVLLEARAKRVPHAEVAAEYIKLSGEPSTADQQQRVEGRLRQRASTAASRAGVRAADERVVGKLPVQAHDAAMKQRMPLYIREQFFDESVLPPDVGVPTPPEADLSEADDLGDADSEDDDDLDDEGYGDEDEDE